MIFQVHDIRPDNEDGCWVRVIVFLDENSNAHSGETLDLQLRLERVGEKTVSQVVDLAKRRARILLASPKFDI